MRKAKKKTPAQIAESCAEYIQRIVRLKAAIHNDSPYISCVSCGTVDHWTQMQGGHYIPRGVTSPWRGTALKIVEENIHPQCKRCNLTLQGNSPGYTRYMVETYGQDMVDEIEAVAIGKAVNKWNRLELEDLLTELKAQNRELMEKVKRL